MVHLVALLCVLAMAVGQLMFKLAAQSWQQTGQFMRPSTLAITLGAMLLYGATSLAWIWVLQKAELGKVYPIMALAFVLVPFGSFCVFGERFSSQYLIGVALILVGILVATQK